MTRRLPLACALLSLIFALSAGCGKKKAADPVIDPAAPIEKKSVSETDKTWETAVADLKGKSTAKRAAAVRALSQYQPAHAIPILAGALNDKTYSDGDTIFKEPNSAREAAILGLQKFGKEGEKEAVEKGLPILKAALKESDPGVKVHALLALMLLGPQAKSASGDVLILCEDKDEAVRRTAFDAMQKIGAADPVEFGLMLGNSDAKVVYDAAKAINAIRPLPKDVVPMLMQAIEKPLAENEPEELGLVRQEVAEALASLGKDAAAAVPALVSQMVKTTEDDFSKFFRPRPEAGGTRTNESPTMMALRKIGKPAVPALIEVLGSDKPFAVWQAARVLAGIGPDAKEAIPALQKIFDKEADRIDSDVMMMTAAGLAMLQAGADPVPLVTKFTELLALAMPLQRWEVAYALAFFGRKGAPAAAAVTKLLDDEIEFIRAQAVLTLTAFGPGAREAVPALTMRLGDANFEVRRAAVAALKSIGPVAAEVGPSLSILLAEEDEAFRRDVMEAIIALGPNSKADVAALAKLARSKDDRDRVLAIDALTVLGPEAKSAVPDLLTDLRETRRDPDNRAAVMRAVGRIGLASPDVIKALGLALQDQAMKVRIAAARSLAELGPAAKGAEGALKTFGNGRDPLAGVWAAVAMYKIGIDKDASLKRLVAALQDHTAVGKAARLGAMDAAVLLGPDAKGVVPELLASLGDRTPVSQYDPTPVGIRAAQALSKMGPAAKEAVKKLTALLKEPDPVQKKVVIETLGDIGPDAAFATARLREIARTEPQFAEAALAAVEKIETAP